MSFMELIFSILSAFIPKEGILLLFNKENRSFRTTDFP